MTAREKLEKAKTLGKTKVSKDKKTKTTTNKGWSITTGVQKKTLPAPKAKPRPSTAGKTVTYHGGKSTVVDLGHNPTKSAISKATTQLRTATKTTKPKVKKNTASAVPKVKVPQPGATDTKPDVGTSPGSNTAGKIVAAGVALGTAGTAYAMLKGRPGAITEAKLPGGDPKQFRLPGAEPKLPAPLKGLPGPEQKPTKRQVLDDLRAKAAPKVAKVAPPTGPKQPAKVKVPSTWAERGVRGETVDVSVSKPAKVKPPTAGTPLENLRARVAPKGKPPAEGTDLEALRARVAPKGKPPTAGTDIETLRARTEPTKYRTAFEINKERRKAQEAELAKQGRKVTGIPAKPHTEVQAGVEAVFAASDKKQKERQQRRAPDVADVRPPPETPAPKIAPAPEPAPAPKPVKTTAERPKVGRLDGVPEAPKPAAVRGVKLGDAPKVSRAITGKTTADLLAEAKAENVKLKGEVGVVKVEAPTSTAPIPDTTPETARSAAGDLRGVDVEPVEPTAAAQKKGREKQFYRQRGKVRKAAKAKAIEAKGIATIPTDPAKGAVEESVVLQKKAERNLLDATVRAAEGGKVKAKPGPAAVGAERDRRPSTEVFGKEAVAEKARVIDAVPPDLETEHGGGRQRGTIGDIIKRDEAARLARGEQIRAAAGKVRNVAASRNASPEQMENLERAVDAEYDRDLKSYFEEVTEAEGGLEQRGPRKPDQPSRFLDPIYEAEAELATAREAAVPPAPSDRKTLDQKIELVKKRMAAGGESIYKGGETLRMLENLRDNLPQEPKPPKSTRALPPVAAIEAERLTPDRPSIRAARREGRAAGVRAQQAKVRAGAPGPVQVPALTKPGVVPVGPTTPPTAPARERGVVRPPPKSYAQILSERMANWSKKVYDAQIKRLKSPFLDVAGEKAGATFSTEARIKAAKGLGVAAVGFTALGAGEAYAAEYDPKKRLGAAGRQFKADLPEVTKGVAAFTAADIGLTKAVPAAVSAATKAIAAKAGVEAGKATARAAFARGATAAFGRLGLAGFIGYHAMPYTGKKLAELTHVAVEARKSAKEAKREKKGAEAKYGTVELATRTRHAKEAAKRRQALEAKKGKK